MVNSPPTMKMKHIFINIIKKMINTNRNIDRIFLLVNYRRILPTELSIKFILSIKSVNKIIGKL